MISESVIFGIVIHRNYDTVKLEFIWTIIYQNIKYNHLVSIHQSQCINGLPFAIVWANRDGATEFARWTVPPNCDIGGGAARVPAPTWEPHDGQPNMNILHPVELGTIYLSMRQCRRYKVDPRAFRRVHSVDSKSLFVLFYFVLDPGSKDCRNSCNNIESRERRLLLSQQSLHISLLPQFQSLYS